MVTTGVGWDMGPGYHFYYPIVGVLLIAFIIGSASTTMSSFISLVLTLSLSLSRPHSLSLSLSLCLLLLPLPLLLSYSRCVVDGLYYWFSKYDDELA